MTAHSPGRDRRRALGAWSEAGRALARRVARGRRARAVRSALQPVGVVIRSATIVAAVRLARLMPPRLGYTVADLLGRIRAATPSGRRELERLRTAFPERDDHGALVRARAAIATRNHVAAARLLRPGVADDLRRHRRVCSPAATALLDGGGSFVLAAGHVALELFVPFADRSALDRDLWIVVGTGIDPDQHPWEQRAHRRAVDAYNRAIADRGGVLVELGDATAVRGAIRALQRPGRALMVLADADVDDSAAVVRPFAGRRDVPFSTGPAQLARLAKVPILVCTPHRDGPDVVFEWSDPVEPPSARAGDVDVTNQILDIIERDVGRYPAQYSLPIGRARQWVQDGWRRAR